MVIGEKRTTRDILVNNQSRVKFENGDRSPLDLIMLFDLSIHGHHPAYIHHVIQDWHLNQRSEALNIVVSPRFLEYHADVVELAAKPGFENVRFVAIAPQVEAQLKPRTSTWQRMVRSFQEWQILCEYAQKLKPSHCLAMYFDTCQMPMLLGQKSPCPVSGIYFKPSFHYPNFVAATRTWKEQLQHWREKVLLRQVLRHSSLHTLFSLDPFVSDCIKSFACSEKMIALPDPVQMTDAAEGQVTQLRQRLSIAEGRQVFLLFGALNGRKGIYQLLQAIAQLPQPLSEKMCLVLVGQASSKEQVQMLCQIEILLHHSSVQVISHYEFVPESDVPLYFQMADVVLAPYQKHVGMSGILIWAAMAQRPVLSSDYGLMGELVRRYSLGLAVDSSCPAAIAQGLTQFLQSPVSMIGDRQQMRQFASQNSAEQFAKTICQRLLPAQASGSCLRQTSHE
jgi:glycosyltransferase involved in cell wall biosynthesis